MKIKRITFLIIFLFYSSQSYAWFFIFPIPNLKKPPALERLIETLEKSTETKAIAYVSEDKTFGTVYWTFGHYVGKLSQQEADKIALEKWSAALEKAKLAEVGGVKTYDYGDKKCELHQFSNNNSNK